jgi:hypothetical protein
MESICTRRWLGGRPSSPNFARGRHSLDPLCSLAFQDEVVEFCCVVDVIGVGSC